MKSPIPFQIPFLLALAGAAAADLPKKAPITKYSGLWVNSPFTSKPPPAEGVDAPNPLDDYALIGISPIGGSGHRVTLINKKKPEERITVDSDNSKSGFKILGVTRKTGDPLGTVVRMSSGSMTGTVSFDLKLLTLAPPAPKAVPPQPGQVQPGQPVQLGPNGQPMPQRQPRPRVVPPPAPQVGGQVQPNQPQVNQPIQQPVQQIQQNQQNNQNQQRPSRRGN